MTQRSSRVRPLLGGAAFGLLILISAGCSSDSSDVAATSAESNGSSTVASTGSAVDSTTPTSVDPTALLQQALAGLQAGYHFTSLFTVNGTEVLKADGDRIGDASRFSVTTNGALVNYITTPGGNFAQPDGGDWDQLTTQPAVVDPITSLNAPSAITVLSNDGAAVRLRVTVSAVTLGVGASGTADVDVVITSGAITEIGYTTSVNGSVGSVATTIGPVVDSTPIVAPI
jgi:hypothetical protein